MVKAVLLDRDGVINQLLEDGSSMRSPRSLEEFKYTTGIQEFVKQLRVLQYEVAVITNQPEVKRKLVSKTVVDSFHKKIMADLGIRHFFVCWHDNEDHCNCRKPKPGLIKLAAKELNIDLKESYMIGDRMKDMEAAKLAGIDGLLYIKEGIQGFQSMNTFSQIIDFISKR